jgi:hypothetical protein
MLTFESVEEFRPQANNFYLMFMPVNDPAMDMFRWRPAYNRFVRLHPTLVSAIDEALAADGGRPGPQTWPLLLEAYNLMAGLVALSDQGVVTDLAYPERDPETGVDALHLTR